MEIQKNAGVRILVVDDEPEMRDLWKFGLGSRGYAVSTASDGADGVEKARKEKFDVVICDMQMPRMDGIATLEEIRKTDPNVKVIMVTGFATVETAVDSMKKGAYDFLQKPIHMGQALTLIERALSEKDLEAQVALYEASKAIFSTVRLEELFEIVMDMLQSMFKADECSLMLLDKDTLYVAASRGFEKKVAEMTRLKIGDLIAGRVALEKKAVLLVEGLNRSPEFRDLEANPRIGSSIVTPLISQKELLGVLNINRLAGHPHFAPLDFRNACIFASQVAQAVRNAKLYEELGATMRAVKKANGLLEEVKDQLVQSEKLAAVGQLISGVAHEINNPLTAIIGYADLLAHSDVEKKIKEQIAVMFQEAQRCRRIVQDLLFFARRKEPRLESVEIATILDDIVKSSAGDLAKRGTEIKKNHGPCAALRGDPVQLRQVFLNIVTNAMHALEETPAPRRITISSFGIPDGVKVTIQDNGPGIDEKYLRKIFEPFFSTKEVGKGTGLGLSISYGIVKAHGGELTVSSQKGKGALFTIELPSKSLSAAESLKDAAPRADPRAAPRSAPGPQISGRRVLVVEDEESIRTFITRVLSEEGCLVETAADGEVALGKLEAGNFDLVLCDCRIPKLDGIELFKTIKLKNPGVAERFLFVTGSSASPDYLESFFHENGLLRLFKPFTLEELFNIIGEKLRHLEICA